MHVFTICCSLGPSQTSHLPAVLQIMCFHRSNDHLVQHLWVGLLDMKQPQLQTAVNHVGPMAQGAADLTAQLVIYAWSLQLHRSTFQAGLPLRLHHHGQLCAHAPADDCGSFVD